MHSDDSVRSDEVVNFFTECLHDQGLEQVEVTQTTSPESLSDVFYVRKRITNNEIITYKTTFDAALRQHDVDTVKKEIVIEAEKVAREFKNKLVTEFEWGDRCVEVSPYDGGWAKCLHCGTEVDAPRAQYLITESCELSDPMPVERDMSHELEQMTGNQRVLFRMYLIGILRASCEPQCPNSKYNRKI